MKSRFARIVVLVCCVALLLQVTGLWWHTGRRTLTRFADPARAARDREVIALNALLDGPTSAPAAPFGPPNDFALGLLPFGWGRHSISVITLALPALLVMVIATRGPRQKSS